MSWADLLYEGTIPPVVAEKPKPVVKIKPKPDHSEAKAIYAAYLIKAAELAKHREYAERVAKATDGQSQTPVMPLACMGTNGGPLLCDHCNKPIILEGGKFHKVYADVAWKANPLRSNKWMSFISGGLMVRIVDNGTLRIYHGYDGSAGHCCTIAKAAMDAAEAKFTRDNSKGTLICKFLRDEFPEDTDRELDRKLTDIMNVMFSFDPSYGVNVPCS